MIRITFKEARKIGFEHIQIKITEDGLEYYRKNIPLYIVRYWFSTEDFTEKKFNRLSDAERWAKRKYRNKNYDIVVYRDKSDRYWKRQYQYIKGILIGVDEQ